MLFCKFVQNLNYLKWKLKRTLEKVIFYFIDNLINGIYFLIVFAFHAKGIFITEIRFGFDGICIKTV